ncbi:MAG: SDR family oxidoreductase [Nanoarchaeota archaeon]|nr:SDR family oxidoreductase [Nanoarchaeota archaeon]
MIKLTALITGASGGLGAEFARQLAEKNYDLILVARKKDRLDSLADELQKNYSNKCDILVSDLSTYEGMEKVEDYIRKLDSLDTLINNAGFGIPKRFQDVPLNKLQDMINLHIIAPTRLCYAAIPIMIKQKKGAIINVSSLASLIPKSKSAIYSATKSYLTMFSKTLQGDLEKEIKIQALCPGFTHTDFHDTKEFKDYNARIPEFLWRDPEYVVKKSLKELDKSIVICVPGFENKILVSLMNNKLISSLLWKYHKNEK